MQVDQLQESEGSLFSSEPLPSPEGDIRQTPVRAQAEGDAQWYTQPLSPDEQKRYFGLTFDNQEELEEIREEQTQLQGQLKMGKALAEDDDFQYVTLLNNGSNGDLQETAEAQNMAVFTRNLLAIFRESLDDLYQEQNGKNRQNLQTGQPVLWHMQTKNRNGLPGSQGFDQVILNPTRQPGHKKPVIEIVFPHTNVLQTVTERLERERLARRQHQSDSGDDSGHGKTKGPQTTHIKTLAWVANPLYQKPFVDMTVNMLVANGEKPTSVVRKLKALKGSLSDIRDEHTPDQKGQVEERLNRLATESLGLTPRQSEQWTTAAYKALGPARYTYFPHLASGAYQPIDPAQIPVRYKGVELQEPDVKNLLIGNAVELKGLKDERRATPYRAVLNWNLLKGQTESREDQKEELKTDRKQEATRHEQMVNGRGADAIAAEQHQRQQQTRNGTTDADREDKRRNRSPRVSMGS